MLDKWREMSESEKDFEAKTIGLVVYRIKYLVLQSVFNFQKDILT